MAGTGDIVEGTLSYYDTGKKGIRAVVQENFCYGLVLGLIADLWEPGKEGDVSRIMVCIKRQGDQIQNDGTYA